MTDPIPAGAAVATARFSFLNPPSPPAIALWAGVQVLAILLAAGSFPIWAHHPYPRSSLGLAELMTMQIIAVALLAPVMSQNNWTIIANLAITLVFTELAGLLASEPQSAIGWGFLLVCLWQIGICGWSRKISSKFQVYLVICAILYVGGGAILRYLGEERATVEISRTASWTAIDPLGRMVEGTGIRGWIVAAVPLVLWLLWLAISHLYLAQRRPSIPLH